MTSADAESEVRGVTSSGLVYGRRGSGLPVVFVHGWCLNRRVWMYEEERLCSRYGCYSPDLPGFGESAHLGGPYGIDRQVDALAELLADLDIGGAVLVGFAFGAAVAMTLAARGEARVAGLVLVGLPAAQPGYAKWPAAMRRDWPEFARRSARAICGEAVSEASLAWLEAMFVATPLPPALAIADFLAAFDPMSLLPSLRVPTLFVHGAADTIVPSSVATDCAAIQGGRAAVIADAGHLVMIERRAAFAEALDEHLTFVARARGPHR